MGRAVVLLGAVLAAAMLGWGTVNAAPPPTAASCTYERGIVTCVFVSERTETAERTVVGGCLFGPEGRPGRRTTTFRDTFRVTETTTITVSRGPRGPEFDSRTTVTRELISSQQIASRCEPL